MGRSRSGAAPGRTVTLAGFLLGTVSGSGVATTVTLGSVAWPLLRGAGYRPEVGGAILSAAGIGAIISPPTLGAAAFLIAEFLQDLVPAGARDGDDPDGPLLPLDLPDDRSRLAPARHQRRRCRTSTRAGTLFRRYGYHFTSLVAIAVFMVAGMSAFRAVFWATVLAVGAELRAARDAR